ncbi:exonuclease family protein, partial [Reticulomyxa filosa]
RSHTHTHTHTHKKRYSGITAEILSSVEWTLQQVQQDMWTFMDQKSILIGHSLENDLKALQLVHTRVIDTAVLFMVPRSQKNGRKWDRKLSLKHLAEQCLNKTIQDQEANRNMGHSSVEDATAAMELVLLKLKWEEERDKRLGTFESQTSAKLSAPPKRTSQAHLSHSSNSGSSSANPVKPSSVKPGTLRSVADSPIEPAFTSANSFAKHKEDLLKKAMTDDHNGNTRNNKNEHENENENESENENENENDDSNLELISSTRNLAASRSSSTKKVVLNTTKADLLGNKDQDKDKDGVDLADPYMLTSPNKRKKLNTGEMMTANLSTWKKSCKFRASKKKEGRQKEDAKDTKCKNKNKNKTKTTHKTMTKKKKQRTKASNAMKEGPNASENKSDVETNTSKKDKNVKKKESSDKTFKKSAHTLVVQWCREQLHPLYKQNKISKTSYADITKKCVYKVLHSVDTWNATELGLLHARQKKVIALIKAYVDKEHTAI